MPFDSFFSPWASKTHLGTTLEPWTPWQTAQRLGTMYHVSFWRHALWLRESCARRYQKTWMGLMTAKMNWMFCGSITILGLLVSRRGRGCRTSTFGCKFPLLPFTILVFVLE